MVSAAHSYVPRKAPPPEALETQSRQRTPGERPMTAEMQRAPFDMAQVIEGQQKTSELTYEGLRKMMADQR
eukprot:3452281-Pyramimonas_sp.AAC.1